MPTAARCERPKGASAKSDSFQVGGLAQGPEEKRGFVGRVAGFVVTITGILTDNRPSLGKGVPLTDVAVRGAFHNLQKSAKPP